MQECLAECNPDSVCHSSVMNVFSEVNENQPGNRLPSGNSHIELISDDLEKGVNSNLPIHTQSVRSSDSILNQYQPQKQE